MYRKNISKTLIMAIFILFITTTTVIGEPFDLIHKTNPDKNHTFNEFTSSPSIFEEVVNDVENYLIESLDGKLYFVSEVDQATADGTSFRNAVSVLEPYDGDKDKNIEADAILTTSLPEQDTYTIILYNAEIVEVQNIFVDGEEVEFEIVSDNIKVSGSENTKSIVVVIKKVEFEAEIILNIEEELSELKKDASELLESDYTIESWMTLVEALNMIESNEKEKIQKIKNINIALNNLTEKVQYIGTFNELFYENKSSEVKKEDSNIEYKGIEVLPAPGVYNIYLDKTKLESKLEHDLDENIDIKMKYDNKFILDSNLNEEFLFYDNQDESFFYLPAVQDSINTWTELSVEKLGITDSASTHSGEVYIINE